MTRTEILKSPEYWVASIQVDLYNCAEKYMSENGMNRTQLAEHLGVSKGYVSQLLNGEYDHKLSKLVELALKFNVVPRIEFEDVQEFIQEDINRQARSWNKREYSPGSYKKNVITTDAGYAQVVSVEYGKVA